MQREIVVAASILLLVATSAVAQDQLIDLGSKGARVSRAARGRTLQPGGPDRVETVRAFLRGRHDETTLRDLVQTRDHAFRGVTHITMRQRVAGLDVYGTYVRSSFTATGDLVSVVENLVSTARALRPSQIGPDEALAAAMARFYPDAGVSNEGATVGDVTTFSRVEPLREPPTVTRIALPFRGAVLDTGYLVATWDRENVLRHTVVSGRGEVLHVELRTSPDSYRIFPVSPGVSGQVLVQGPAPSEASPDGWLGISKTTIGNNVNAYLDRNTDDVPDPNGRPNSGSQTFDFTWDGTVAPTVTLNQLASVTNLFYLNNVLHDRLYSYGFTESAGNFQAENFGRGGAGADPVHAQGQDGGGVNNANFATPPDGASPRMQMYLWNTAAPERDGNVDSDIVYHEYGHGLTWRMIGDMSGATGSAVGEGMSDTLATYFNNDDRVAEYSNNNPVGIRQYPYAGYPRTYGLVVGILGPHLDGEIYAATMWRLRELWLGRGWSQDTLLRYIVDGMNYTTPRPAYEDMRDGILASIATLDSEVSEADATCTVWDAFAQFGVGVGASGTEICAIGLCFFKATESFAKPEECAGTTPANTAPVVTILLPDDSDPVPPGTTISFSGTALDEEDGDISANLSWSSNIQPGGTIGSGASFSRSDLVPGTHTITATVTDNGGLPGSRSVVVSIATAQNTAPVVTINSPSAAMVSAGTSVTFSGTATDAEQGDLSAGLVWTSSLQGAIGNGTSFTRADLVEGTHTIIASVTDNGGLGGSDSVVLTIEASEPPQQITLSATTRKVKGSKFVDLSWSGASGGSVDIKRNGAVIASGIGGSTYTDTSLPKKSSTYTYQVCNAGTATCSNTVAVTF